MFIAGTYRSGCVSFLVDGTCYDEEAEKKCPNRFLCERDPYFREEVPNALYTYSINRF